MQRNYPVIAQSLQLAASPQLRNMATLGGNVLQRTRCTYFRDVSYTACNKRNPGSGCAAMDGVNRMHAVLGTSDQCIATYPGDFAQALIALDANVEIAGKSGTRTMPFAQLHKRPGNTPHIETALAPGELISGIHHQRPLAALGLSQGARPAVLRVRACRRPRSRSMCRMAWCSEARVALGGVATVPWRAREAEALLKGLKFDDGLAGRVAEAAFAGATAARAQRLQDRSRQARGRPRAAQGRNDGDLTMSTAAPEPKANMGQPVPRYDAVAKVTGRARYAADVPLANPAFAYLVTSAIAKGRVESFDLADAKKVRGVIDIVTHENAEKLKDAKLFSNGGYASTTIQPLKSADIAHDGQIIAVVVAETFEAAREAAHRVKVSYSEDKPTASFDSPGTTSARAKGQLASSRTTPRSAISPRHSTRPRSSSRRPTRRRRSITIRWSCSPPVASGTAIR